jgi:flagellin
LRAQIRGLGQAERNANDGISLVQTAEGAMSELTSILIRQRELAVQSANDTVGSVERTFIQQEVTQLREEINRIAEVAEFNGTKLLDGTVTTVAFQVGIQDTTNDRILVQIDDVHASNLGDSTITNGVMGVDVTTVTGAREALNILDEAITDMSRARSELGATQNRLQVTIANLATARENLSAAKSRIRDADVAHETSNLTRANILMQAGISVLAQANQAPALALSLLG